MSFLYIIYFIIYDTFYIIILQFEYFYKYILFNFRMSAADTLVMDHLNSKYQNENQLSEIQSFYNGTTILLTGATGFMGNLILEKLIR